MLCLLKKLFLTFSLLVPPLLLASSLALAETEFDTTFNATYTVNPAGVTQVTQEVNLTNRLSNIYASEYTLTIGSTQINNVSAFTPKGIIPIEVTQTENSTNIHLKFTGQHQVVGKGQTLSFTITYQNLDIASKNGRVLEVNIPKLANIQDIQNYTVTLLVPQSFDQPTLITPQPTSQDTNPTHRILKFTQDQLGSKGISVLFGTYQNFAFTLRYNLENPTLSRGSTTIALPPDTAYQKVIYQSLDPQPLTVTTDADGNWLAQYQLSPQQKLQVTATGNALLYLQPSVPVPPPAQNQLGDYLTSQPFWPVNDPSITDLALKLKTPENIYNFVVANLTYNYARIEDKLDRLGASAALQNPQNAICTEFTDLFIAIARAANIPARAVNGFAYTSNPKLRPLSLIKDVLHAWPEYFNQDKKIWVPIDPTWGNTTQGIDYFNHLDLNHFSFVIHGQDSSAPYPAGSYKLATTQGKDVNIAFAQDLPQQNTALDISLDLPSTTTTNLSLQGQIIIKNTGNVAIHSPQLKLDASGFLLSNPQNPSAIINSTIPPYGQLAIPLELKSLRWWDTGPQTITVSVNDQTQDFTLNLTPLSFLPLEPVLSLALGTALAAISLFTGHLLVHRRQKIRPLPGQSQKPQGQA